jgi:hypothetical protein
MQQAQMQEEQMQMLIQEEQIQKQKREVNLSPAGYPLWSDMMDD